MRLGCANLPGVADETNVLKVLAEAVKRVEELFGYIPDGNGWFKDLGARIATLRGLILEHRPPAVVLFGRRGAGKSSLINALFGAKVAELGHVKARTGRGRWFDYQGARGALTILDTRGFQEGSTPEELDSEPATGAPPVVNEIKRKAPDLVLFLAKASEVDAAIDGDLEALERAVADAERYHGVKPPILGVVTHCDLLEPKSVQLHKADLASPEDVEEKLGLVAAAERALEAKLKGRTLIAGQVQKVIGISSYLSFRQDGSLRGDERWRIDDLSALVYKALPDAGRGVFVRISRVKSLQEELAINLTRATAAVCAAIAAMPIPLADVVPITSLQVSLIASIAWLSGRSLDARASTEFLASVGANVGLAFALREAVRALSKIAFPGGGAAISAGVAFAGTMALGAAARAYYLRGATIEEARQLFEEEKLLGPHIDSDPTPQQEAADRGPADTGEKGEAEEKGEKKGTGEAKSVP